MPFSSMHNIRVFVLVAKEHPEIVEFGNGTSATSASTDVGASAAPGIEAAATNIDINKGLESFQIVPNLMTSVNSTNMDFFAHMIMHCNINFDASYSGSNHLGLDISHRQLECLRPTDKDLYSG